MQGTSSVHSALRSFGHLSATALSWTCYTLLCSGSLEATPSSRGHHTNLGSHCIAASDLAGVTLKTEPEMRPGGGLGTLWRKGVIWFPSSSLHLRLREVKAGTQESRNLEAGTEAEAVRNEAHQLFLHGFLSLPSYTATCPEGHHPQRPGLSQITH